MFKRWISAFLVIIMVLSMVPVEAFAGESGISITSASVAAGNTVSISVKAANLENIGSLELLVTYDPEVMDVSSVSYGTLTSGNMNDTNTSVSGEISYKTMNLSGMSGSGNLLTITFRIAADCPAGVYPIAVAVGEVYDTGFGTVSLSGSDGSVTVTKAAEKFSMYAYSNATTFQKGDTFRLRAASAGRLPFTGGEFIMEYDSTLLQFEELVLENPLNTEGCVYDVNTAVDGTIRLSFISPEVVETFYLFQVVFTVIGNVDTTTGVTVTAAQVYKENLETYAPGSAQKSITLKKTAEVEDHPDVYLNCDRLVVGQESGAELVVASGGGLAAADFVITYDPSIFRIQSVTAAEDVAAAGGSVVINDAFGNGQIRFSYINPQADSAQDLSLVQIRWIPLVSPGEHYAVVPAATGVVDLEQNALRFDYITAAGCIYAPVVTPPSCTAGGYTTYTCQGCGDSYVADPTAILPHSYESNVLVCDDCGFTRGVTSITMYSNPDKTEYLERAETLDLTGAVLSVTCDDGQTVQIPVTDDMVQGFNNQTVGNQIIMVTYEGKTTAFLVTVKEIEIESIQVIPPAKTEYLEGSALDVTGGQVKILYRADNGYYELTDLTPDMISGYDPLVPGEQIITVTYEGFSAQFRVSVTEKTAVSMEIADLPEKLRYFAKKDTLDVTGGKVTVSYDNGTVQTLDMTADMVSGFDNTVAGDQILTVTYEGVSSTFEIHVYTATVKFVNWNGEQISTAQYMYGDRVAVPQAPSKEADNTYEYLFAGWDAEVVECQGDATYTAVFTPVYIDYTVVFADEDSTVISEKTYHYGDAVIPPEDPVKEADETYTYTFAGWDKTVGNCQGDAVYTAVYTREYIDYTVVFQNWDGTVLSEKTYHYGETILQPENPVRAEDHLGTYTFAGWDSEVDVCEGNAVFTAQYTIQYTEYTVVFRNWDGEVICTRTCRYGDAVEVPEDPTREADPIGSYMFAGWNPAVGACAGNITYTAQYDTTYMDYSILFQNWDGTVISSGTYHYGDTVEVPENPERESDQAHFYTFAGWDGAVGPVSGDAVYTATYRASAIDETDPAYHTFSAYVSNNDATCTADGTKTAQCIYCELRNTIVDTGSKLEHDYVSVTTAPTCTAEGYTTHTCSCGESYVDSYVEAQGHNWGDWMSVAAAGCTTEGEDRRDCDACDHYELRVTNALGHDEIGHEAKAANCTEIGWEAYVTCSRCDYSTYEELPMLEHKYGDWVADGDKEMRTCTVCKAVEERETEKEEPIANPFVDVKEADYFYDPVLWAVENGITNGTSPTTFSPDAPCTRAHVVTFLWRYFHEPDSQGSNPFTDVFGGAYFYEAVLWAVENGITNGTSPYTFSPEATCTRGQIVTFLYRALT